MSSATRTRLSDRRSTTLALAAYAAIAIVWTWPLGQGAGSLTVPEPFGDTLLNAWILAWDADRILHGFRDYWDGLFFYPYRGTITYSEHLLGIAIFTAPVQWITGNPIAAYNAALIGSTALAGFGTFLLVRELTGRPDAAFIAGLAFAGSPYRINQILHLQVLASGWMPIALWALHRFFRTGAWRAALGFAAAFVLQALSNGYFLYFLVFPVAIVSAYGLWQRRCDWREPSIKLLVAFCAIAMALTPIALTYFHVHRAHGFRRTVEDMVAFSADLSAYAHISERLRIWQGVLPIGGHERELFPGLTLVLLAVAGFGWCISRCAAARGPTAVPQRHTTWMYFCVLLVGLFISLGPRPSWQGYELPFAGPYTWIAAVLPGFDGLRVPARAAVLVYLALAVLGGSGLAFVTRPAAANVRRVLVTVVALLIAVEGYGGPVPSERFPPSDMLADQPAYEWLRDQPAGAVLELPVGRTRESVRYLYRTLLHRHRILNGYSGYGTALQELAGGPPFTEIDNVDHALTMARAVGVRWLVVHPPLYSGTEFGTKLSSAISETGHVMRTKSFDAAVVMELRPLHIPWPPAVDPAWRELQSDAFDVTSSHSRERLLLLLDGDRATRWLTGVRQQGREWIELRFDRRLDVARVRLEMDRRSWGDYPRGLVVEGVSDDKPAEILFSGGVLDRLALSILHEPRTSAIDLLLPPNQTTTLRLRTMGSSRIMFWSVHELRVWTR